MASLSPDQHDFAEEAFYNSDEGNKGYLHSKEFFYACQALGFNYTFVETFEMYKIYDDNNSLRMNLDEFKRFYEAKLKDPESHVDPTKVSNVYNRNGSAGTYIQPGIVGNSYRQGTATTTTNTLGGNLTQNYTTAGPAHTTYVTGAPVSNTYTTSHPVNNTYTSSINQGTVVRTIPATTGYTTAPTTTYVTGGTGYATVNGEMSKYDIEGKGYITKEQLRVACKDLAVKCDTEEELDSIWREIDNNNSGKINGIEFGEFYDYVHGFRDEVRQYQAQYSQ